MPNTAGSSFFSWLRFGKKKPKKTGRREALTTGRGPIPGHREPDQPTRDVRLPDALRAENERRERERLERERAPELRTPPPPLAPPPIRTAPIEAAPAPKAKSAGETMIIRVPEQPQGDVVGVLIGVLGPLKNELYRVYAGSTRLGRIDPDNSEKGGEFHDRDMAISRQHGTLVQLEDGAFHIKPLSAQKPINVNGERLEEDGEMIRDGDSVQMGQSTFRFKVLT